MKVSIQSLVASAVVHAVFVLGTIGVGFVKTLSFVPELSRAGETVTPIQNEIAFGMAGSPYVFAFTFAAVVLLCNAFQKEGNRYMDLRGSNQ